MRRERRKRRSVDHVGPAGMRFAAAVGDHLRRLFRAADIDVGDHDPGAGVGERLGEGAAQSAGRARHHDAFVVEPKFAHEAASRSCTRCGSHGLADCSAIRASAAALPASVSIDGKTKSSSIATVSCAGMPYQPPIVLTP